MGFLALQANGMFDPTVVRQLLKDHHHNDENYPRSVCKMGWPVLGLKDA